MKKIILAVAVTAALSTQAFGANTAFLSKVMAKMTDDIMALKAKSVYQDEEIKSLKGETVVLKDALNKANIKVAESEAKLEKLDSKTLELAKVAETANEIGKEAKAEAMKAGDTINNYTTKDGRVDGMQKRLDGLEKTLGGMSEDDEQIDPEVEKRILKYIESK